MPISPEHAPCKLVHDWKELARTTLPSAFLRVVVEGFLQVAVHVLPSLLTKSIQVLVFSKEIREMSSSKAMEVVGHDIDASQRKVLSKKFTNLFLKGTHTLKVENLS